KYAANWNVALGRAEGELILTLDRDHDFQRARIKRFWQTVRAFDDKPFLGMAPFLMGSYNQKFSLGALSLGVAEQTDSEVEQEAKDEIGANSVYGKFVGRREVIVSDYAVGRPDDAVAEDVETGMGVMSEGWKTDHFTSFEIDQSQPSE